MYKWNTAACAIALLLLTGGTTFAQDISQLQGGSYCGIDLNDDGDYDGEGEIASCDNGVCPFTAAECVTNRVRQICDEDTQVTSCAPDEQIETCEPDTTTRQCDPDTINRICEPDTTRRVCEPDTTRRECDPSTTRRECDPSTTRRECDPSTTRRECDPPTTRRVCEAQPDTRVCSSGYYERQCETLTVSVCPFSGRQCFGDRFCVHQPPGCRTRDCLTYATCTTQTQQVNCANVWVPGTCTNVPQPDICRNVTTPGGCRNVTVPGECRTVTVPGQCRNVTVPGDCRNVTVPGACHNEAIPGACTNEVVPGECRDIVIPGECTSQTVPGKCTTVTVPGECRNEPLPDSCPIVGVDECRIGSDGISRCSDTLCVNTANTPIEQIQRDRIAYVDDGQRDASGECLNDIQVFSGRGMDCRRPGLLTLFKNCCKNRGQVLTDSSGGARIAAISSTVTMVFAGAEAAFSALTTGASVSAAASAGTAAMAAAAGPAAIGAGVVLLFSELLSLGCDQQDMETAILEGSGMCHFVGTYCIAKLPFIGCIQKARSYCCFNSKLGRIIHEQGRQQLKSFGDWGEPKTPDCRGFTPSEFQALNFAEIDLSEYYSELAVQSEATLKKSFEQGLEAYLQAGSTPND